jgi:hypothetical protein
MADLTPGEKRWTIVFGNNTGLEHQAVLELYRGMQYPVNYVMPLRAAADVEPAGLEHVLLVGTARSNALLAALLKDKAIPAPPGPQGYTLWIGKAPWNPEHRLIALAGADEAGLYHGAQELLARLSTLDAPLDKPLKRRAALAGLPDLSLSEAPAVLDRGIWTWGYVMYDYRRFLDQMARLKMNMLTVWNSEAPLNLDEVADYAHARGIRLIAGFHWGWGHQLELAKAEDRALIRKLALDTYKKEYAGRKIDGIYFQTLTEHTTQEAGGRSIASWCCELVNDIAAELYAAEPGLSIQFGLHATSIRSHYTDLAALDPRIIITWEDAGALPFSYWPDPAAGDGYEATLDYAKQLAAFRPGTPFALVPKGWMCLRWDDEFAKHGPFLLGERAPAFLRERLAARQPEWESRNLQWFRHFPLAARFYREVAAVNPHVIATGLVEDGLLDARIQPSVALFGETIWNPHRSDADLLAAAMRPYLLNTTV